MSSQARTTAFTSLLVFFIFLGAAQGEVRVRALDGSVRVEPLECSILEARSPLGGIGPDPRYLDSNPVFSSERGTVELQSLRNETVAFQVIVETSGAAVEALEVELRSLDGPMQLQRGPHIRLYRQWYVNIERASSHSVAQEATNRLEAWFPVSGYSQRLVNSLGPGWYPDALIPLEGPVADLLSAFPLDIPNELNPVPRQRAQGIWIDVYVPTEAPAGQYRGVVDVRWDGGQHQLPVTLLVLPVLLPDRFHAGIGSVSYDFVGVHLAKAGPSALHRFFQLAHQHRMTIDALYFHPEWNQGDIDWQRYDRLLGPILDGSAFTRERGYSGPGQGRPIQRFVLPVDWNWPTRTGVRGASADFIQALRLTEQHILDKSWTETQWHLFINATDEPRTEEDFEWIARTGERLKSAGLHRPPLFKHRIDAGPFKAIGREIPGWTIETIFERVGESVDVWNACGAVPFVSTEALSRRLREHPDEQAWFYSSNAAGEPAIGSILIDGEALGPRTWGWILFRYGFHAGVSWEIGWPRTTCLENAACSGYGLHGDASLVYLAESLHPALRGEVLPSIRLKGLRRGAEDYEYLKLLNERVSDELAQAYARRLIVAALDDGVVERMNGAWEHDPSVWERIRREMGLVLAGRLKPPPPDTVLRGAPQLVLPPRGISRRASYLAVISLVLIIVLAVVLTERRGRR